MEMTTEVYCQCWKIYGINPTIENDTSDDEDSAIESNLLVIS